MDRLPDILENHEQMFTDYVKCASTCSEDKHGLCQPKFGLCCKLLAKSIKIQETFGARTCQFSNSAYVIAIILSIVEAMQFMLILIHFWAFLFTFIQLNNLGMELGVQNQTWTTVL